MKHPAWHYYVLIGAMSVCFIAFAVCMYLIIAVESKFLPHWIVYLAEMGAVGVALCNATGQRWFDSDKT